MTTCISMTMKRLQLLMHVTMLICAVSITSLRAQEIVLDERASSAVVSPADGATILSHEIPQYAASESFSAQPLATEASDYSTSQRSDVRCYRGDIWELSTRKLGCCRNTTYMRAPSFEVYRIENRYWRKKSFDEFLTAEPAGDTLIQNADGSLLQPAPLTIFYVHGNWMTEENARERIQTIDRSLSRVAKRPYQLVLLSWPSEHGRGIVSDIRENAACADVQAHYLNFVLQRLANSRQISLLGFSFGGRTVIGALHLAAGGSIDGFGSQCGTNCAGGGGPRYRVSLIAPAVDREWISPGGRFEMAPSAMDWLVNLYNSRDPVLRRYRFINSASRPIAAGFRGFGAVADPRVTSPLNMGELIEQHDCGSVVGTSHDERTYYSECAYVRRAFENLLWQ